MDALQERSLRWVKEVAIEPSKKLALSLVGFARKGILLRGVVGIFEPEERVDSSTKRKCSAKIDANGHFIINFSSQREYEHFLSSRKSSWFSLRSVSASTILHIFRSFLRNISNSSIVISVDEKVSSVVSLSLDTFVAIADVIRDDEIILETREPLSIHHKNSHVLLPKIMDSIQYCLSRNIQLNQNCKEMRSKYIQIRKVLFDCVQDYERLVQKNAHMMQRFEFLLSKYSLRLSMDEKLYAKSNRDSFACALLIADTENSNTNLNNRVDSMQSSLSNYQNELDELSDSKKRIDQLLDDKQILQERLIELEDFLVSNRGNTLHELEKQLAETKLLLAQSEAEKDELEMMSSAQNI